MSSSTTSESGEFSGSKAPERSTFSQRCSLLSQALKEKGSFGDLSLAMTCNFLPNATGPVRETKKTMNLFPGNQTTSDSDLTRNRGPSSRNLLRSMELFPQQVSFVPSEEDSSVSKCTSSVPQSAQMTIFYGGQVIVFDDFPADKAKEIMLLASQGSSQGHSVFPPSNVINPAMTHPTVKAAPVECCTISPVPSSSNAIPIPVQPTPGPTASDLPLVRRASLHRFLEKRKDRIISKGPYQVNSPLATPVKPAAESKTWLGLAAQFPQ